MNLKERLKQQHKQGSILFTTLSLLLICGILYTANLNIYQSSRKNLENIRLGYQAQTLAIMARQHLEAGDDDKKTIKFNLGGVTIEQGACTVKLVEDPTIYNFNC